MIFIYLSDAALKILTENEVPSSGQHIGPFLPVLTEAAIWPSPQHPNQFVLDVAPFIHYEVSSARNLTANTPLSQEAYLLLKALKDEADGSTRVHWNKLDQNGNPTPVPVPAPKPTARPKLKKDEDTKS